MDKLSVRIPGYPATGRILLAEEFHPQQTRALLPNNATQPRRTHGWIDSPKCKSQTGLSEQWLCVEHTEPS
jgi:hypothetical protein